MNLGDSTAVGLGVNVEKERRKLLFIAVCLAGASVAVAGGIGFIGLMAPHLARSLVGGKHQIMLPTAAINRNVLAFICRCHIQEVCYQLQKYRSVLLFL